MISSWGLLGGNPQASRSACFLDTHHDLGYLHMAHLKCVCKYIYIYIYMYIYIYIYVCIHVYIYIYGSTGAGTPHSMMINLCIDDSPRTVVGTIPYLNITQLRGCFTPNWNDWKWGSTHPIRSNCLTKLIPLIPTVECHKCQIHHVVVIVVYSDL